MTKIKGNVVILNGTPVKATDYEPVSSSGFIYEVIRLIKGKYLFLDDHLERLIQSCSSTKLACPKKDQIKRSLTELAELSSIDNGNVKLTLCHSGENIETACYFIPHHYPTEEEYLHGVKLKSYAFVRPDPNIKKWNETFRTTVKVFIDREKIYEAVLLNEKNQLTEGSRSNIFFIDEEGMIHSAPENCILPGITRKYILQICHDLDIPLIKKLQNIADIGKMKACFLSGTSPMVLPVQQLDTHYFDAQHPTIKVIKERFLQLAMK